MKAHDVRRLTPCPAKRGPTCEEIVLRENLVTTTYGEMCGRCAFAVLGVGGIKRLPTAELNKFSADQIGWPAMKELCGDL